MQLNRNLLLSFFITCGIATASAQDTVRNVRTGPWSDPTNWSNNVPPGANAVILLNYDLVIDINAVCISINTQGNNITVNPGISLNVTGSAADTLLPAAAEAAPMFDVVSFGIYKGIFTGPSGTFKIAINNETNVVRAYVNIDNRRDTLTCNEQFVSGQPIAGAYFSGQFSYLYFSVNANGTQPTVNINVTNLDTLTAIAVKEHSGQVIKCFEGIIGGDDAGPFGALVDGTSITGLSKSDVYNGQISQVNGSIQNNVITGVADSGSIFNGNLNNNTCAGTWQNNANQISGTWSGKRTL